MEEQHDLEKAMRSDLPEDEPAILLVHEPDFADISGATGRFALQLSGHSHGGQVFTFVWAAGHPTVWHKISTGVV